MPYILHDDILKAREMDLLTYLKTFEPQELVHVSGDTYCTREHDSLKISNGKWHWFSRGIGGKTALDYLIKVKNYTLSEAAEAILGRAVTRPPVFYVRKQEERAFSLPELSESTGCVRRYLRERGIDAEIIGWCIRNGVLAETLKYHNAAFIGCDGAGDPKYASLRSTTGSFKGEVPGSDKRYSFRIQGVDEGSAHLFEGAVDALSYATLLKETGRDWRKSTLLSLGGVYIPRNGHAVPSALEQYLSAHPQTGTIILHLDNDEVGRGAAEGIVKALGTKYRVINSPPPFGKDVNEYLMKKQCNTKKKEDIAR